jgi:hypothetical protein
MAYTRAELEMVDRHIAQGERHVVQQEELITRLSQRGLPTAQAELVLAGFQSALRTHWEHRTAMIDSMELDRKGDPMGAA